MITTHTQFMQLVKPWMEDVKEISKTEFEKLDEPSLMDVVNKTNLIIQTKRRIDIISTENVILGDNEIVAIENSYKVLVTHSQKLKLALLKAGIGGVNLTPTKYCELHELKDRVVVIGCGHNEEHHPHKDQYCIDSNFNCKPDVKIDITSDYEMSYLPDQSFSKVILENLPLTIFHNGNSDTIFRHINRILVKDGILEFNCMYARNSQDYNCPFVIVNGKMKGNTADWKEYNDHLANYFEKVGFKFPENFKMDVFNRTYVLLKM